MARQCSALAALLAAAIGLSLVDVAQSAEIPEGLLPPLIRPSARITLEVGNPDYPPHMRYRYGGGQGNQSAFSADARYLVAADSQSNQMQLWDVNGGKALRPFGFSNQVLALAFAPDGKTLLCAESDNRYGHSSVRLYDVETSKPIRQLDEGVSQMAFTTLAFSSDGKTLALSGVNNRRGGAAVVLWDVNSGDEIRQVSGLPAAAPMPNRFGRQTGGVEHLAFSPDGRVLGLILDRKVILWEVSSGKVRGQVGMLPNSAPTEMEMRHGIQAPNACLTFSPDGRYVAVGCADETIRIFEVLTGRELPPLIGHRGPIRALCFTPDGKTLKSLSWDGKLFVWSATRALRPWEPSKEKLSAETLAALWDNLDTDDPWMIHAIQTHLAGTPAQTVPYLRERLRPVPSADASRIAKLVTEVDSGDYNTRKRAAVELRKLGRLAVPALTQAAQQGGEMAQAMLMRMEGERRLAATVSREMLAVDILERIGTPAAREMVAGLTKGAAEMPLTVRAKSALERMDKPAEGPAGGFKPEALWADLGSDDAVPAYRALKVLVARPKEALPLLRERLRTLPLLKGPDDDPRRIEKLVNELDSDDFAVREKATEELKKLAGRAEKALRARLKSDPPVEVVKRVEDLLKDLTNPTPTRESFHLGRGLETLERIGTSEARDVLQDLLKEASNRQTQEQIRLALQRTPTAK